MEGTRGYTACTHFLFFNTCVYPKKNTKLTGTRPCTYLHIITFPFAVWKVYPALYNHFLQASQDGSRDIKTKSKYSGLSKRLSSLEFVLDLALMCDILFELSQLSLELQKHEMTLIQSDILIKRTIRVIDSFEITDGVYFTEAVKAKENMLFKNIVLNNNNKLKSINKTQFITSVVNNLNMRLIENSDEEKIILQDFQILNKNM